MCIYLHVYVCIFNLNTSRFSSKYVFLESCWFLVFPKAGMPDAVRYLLSSKRIRNSLPGNWQDLLKVCIPLGNLSYERVRGFNEQKFNLDKI